MFTGVFTTISNVVNDFQSLIIVAKSSNLDIRVLMHVCMSLYVVLYAISYCLYKLKNVKSIHGEVQLY